MNIAKRRRRARQASPLLLFALFALWPQTLAHAQAPDPCNPVVSKVACENTLAGDPIQDWQVSGAGDHGIQGFATQMSVNVGQTVSFKINSTVSKSYHIDILRMGFYQGNGARKLTTIRPSVALPQSQPACLTDSTTGLVDCGNWAVSASWTVPTTAVSGIYFAHLQDDQTGADSQIFFVVRDDSSHSSLLFQTSDASWEAYNQFGGNDFYVGGPGNPGRSYAVSYNRPFFTADTNTRDWVFNAEYSMVRFIEANGYDVSYSTDVDSDLRGALIKNHLVYLSTGHDEYWSGQQRTNVEAARDAGVSLAFFGGNSVFWKTRFQNSIDGTNTPYRTVVCYKESWELFPIDPQDPPGWTGTWRDTRFSPPADGARPENALQGNQSTVVQGLSPIQVPAADGKMRFWRGTSVATLPAGQVATLATDTLGYEWNEDLDNGSRPPGTFELSTTTATVTKLSDYGGPNAVFTAPATHHMTIYRAPSGALVFGAGTIQWALGLDAGTSSTTPDVRMQQATVNVFADMGAQPATPQTGLTAATRSTDTTAPVSRISSPAAGATLANGSTVTVSGTAQDSGGGVVGGVEVSTDGGATWHPASGRESWTYAWNVAGSGPTTVETRAVDDSGNLERPADAISVTVNCPCGIFARSSAPATPAANDSASIELGMRFYPDRSGFAAGVRFYKGAGNAGTHIGNLWTTGGQLLATATFANETATGWQEADFATPVALTAGTQYVVSYFAPSGHYAADDQFFTGGGADSVPLHVLQASPSTPQGVFQYAASSAFPATGSWSSNTNYWVDAVFTTNQPPDTTPPAVTATSPPANATGALLSGGITATFSKVMRASSITFSVKDSGGHVVAGTVAYDGGRQTATFTQSAALAFSTTYQATVSGSGLNGTPMSAPFTWSFTTMGVPSCPCTIWPTSAQPATAATSDTGSIEVGVKFRADIAGFVTGIRFFKGAGNTGTHVGNLWTAAGSQLATATFTAESGGGWQQVAFAQPVSIAAGSVYVASYFAPAGHYADTGGYFGTAGVDSGVLHALRAGVSGPQAVYQYSAATAFPATGSGGADSYWVDIVFEPSAPGTQAPTVVATAPAANATGASEFNPVSATFSEAVAPGSVGFGLTGPGGAAVSGTAHYDSTTRGLIFVPAQHLAASTGYTATVTSATDLYGNRLAAPFTWSFTTGTPSCPCTVYAGGGSPAQTATSDPGSVELGAKFTVDLAGSITGVRFFKGAGNTGTHVGNLWSASGQLLARATFGGETASGWQTVAFSQPVAVTPGTVYVASYFAPNGHYAFTGGGLAVSGADSPPVHLLQAGVSGADGVFVYGSQTAYPANDGGGANYWVDVVFEPAPAGGAPSVVATVPASGATGVAPGAALTARFDRAVQPATVSFAVTGPGGAAVAGAVTYDPMTRTAALTAASGLSFSTAYTATVSAAKDLAGTAMAAPLSWSFTTAAASCPCTLWPASTTPATTATSDGNAIEVGVQFTADQNGSVSAVRFSKGAGNTGTHIANLWTASGQLLATATFTNETASGWQQVAFAQPVAITAGQTYVVSYFAPAGHYAFNGGYFSSGPWDAPPLHAQAGVFRYSGASTFPNTAGGGANYWVDLVFA
jgi:hypothetical protein